MTNIDDCALERNDPARPNALTTGNKRAAYVLRGDDLYETPVCATEALLTVEKLPHRIWEPAAGGGAIVDVLRAHGHNVIATDLVDYGVPGQGARRDFLMELSAPDSIECIVTNPPFKIANEFVAHALKLCPYVVMLLRLGFIEGTRRAPILDSGHLARVHVFSRRLPMMHRGGRGTQVAKSNSQAMAFAWYCWERNHAGPATLTRIDWRVAA
jgi:hypothetical protein